jgi:hypothetical protein
MKKTALFCLLLNCGISFAQNEAAKWYFGTGIGLDFLSSPPGLLSGGSMNVTVANGTISDNSGNLLFYTDGQNVWNAQHQVMANGNSLGGWTSSEQSAMIVHQPASTKYYIFTNKFDLSAPIEYAIVDMSLASGSGSVITKNVLLIPGATVSPAPQNQMVVTHHANGFDYWVVFHEGNSNIFRSYLMTSAGLNTVAVTSSAGFTVTQRAMGYYRFSPNGQKLAVFSHIAPPGLYLFDFNPQTGTMSGPSLTLTTDPVKGGEFSADGTKLYTSEWGSNQIIRQWDFCAGSDSAIIASQFTITSAPKTPYVFQLAMDGKIYFSGAGGGNFLGVINNPNLAGLASNITPTGQTISGTPSQGLPAFPKQYLNHVPGIFTYSPQLCGAFSFTAPCLGPMTYSSVKWDFGDISNPATNTSVAFYSSHQYNAPGTYTVKLSVISGTNTTVFYQVISVSTIPNLTVTGKTKICKGESVTLTVGGASTYSWNGTAGSNVMTFTPNASGAFTVTGQDTEQCKATKVHSVEVQPCLGLHNDPNFDALIFPNPGNGLFYLQAPALPKKIVVRDNLGRELLSKQPEDNIINFSQLSDGIYFVEMDFGLRKQTHRIIKSQF